MIHLIYRNLRPGISGKNNKILVLFREGSATQDVFLLENFDKCLVTIEMISETAGVAKID